jgi:hypothetical protein
MRKPCKHQVVLTIDTVRTEETQALYGETQWAIRTDVLAQWCKICGALRKRGAGAWGKWQIPLRGMTRERALAYVRKHV